jgi:hypothetical protein
LFSLILLKGGKITKNKRAAGFDLSLNKYLYDLEYYEPICADEEVFLDCTFLSRHGIMPGGA